MRFTINLRIRIYLILAGLVLISLSGAVVTVWNTYRMEQLLTEIINEDVAAFRFAEEMETALINQKGFVSYYFLDNDPDWLRQLGEYRQIFRENLEKSRFFANNEAKRQAIQEIESQYLEYIEAKDKIIDYYKIGERKTGGKLHNKTRQHFFKILSLCEEYKKLYLDQMLKAKEESRRQARDIRMAASAGMLIAFLLSLLLTFVFAEQIFKPLRILTREAEKRKPDKASENDVISALSQSVRGLIKDAGETHIELQKSRKHLMESEKMAMLGKLAAGTAHSIRNPLTSVKMRLFSLNRSLSLSDAQRDDFEVISEEIRHIDTIVQNFLEFSRPPRLDMQPVSPSLVVDNTIKLLEHRLKSYGVEVTVDRSVRLPEVEADAEQLKEVLANMMINACEAMKKFGAISIREEVEGAGTDQPLAVIRLSDTGPGISEVMKLKIFDPFYTTKDEGTGLGLSIAMRIIEEHRGHLDLESEEGAGATFIIRLPVKQNKSA